MRVTVVRKRHKTLEPIDGPQQVKVGFPAGKAGGFNVQKAIWNHFGTRGGASGGGWGGPIPARPFLTNAVRDNRGTYRNALRVSAKKILLGTTTTRAVLSKLGILAQGHIQASITSMASPPNSPVTVALKGSSNPLIDSGEMRGAVTWDIDE